MPRKTGRPGEDRTKTSCRAAILLGFQVFKMNLAVYLGVVQFFFATTWTLYVIYLPGLAAQAGIGREWVPWILVGDQVIFAVMDIATGFWIDRVRASLARFGGWILGVTVVSCLAFMALPFHSGNSLLLLTAIVVWSMTSSAL